MQSNNTVVGYDFAYELLRIWFKLIIQIPNKKKNYMREFECEIVRGPQLDKI